MLYPAKQYLICKPALALNPIATVVLLCCDCICPSRENQPHRANLLVRQAGTAAGRKSKLGKSSSSSSSNAGAKAAESSKQACR